MSEELVLEPATDGTMYLSVDREMLNDLRVVVAAMPLC